jgi:riboflavin synthase alpha subunit
MGIKFGLEKNFMERDQLGDKVNIKVDLTGKGYEYVN